VGARSVVIKTPDNFEMLVPSKDIVGGRIINWSYNDNTVRGHVEVGVSYDADPEKVRRVLLETCETHRQIMEEPEPHVWLTEFGDNSVHFELLFFFDCRDTVEEKIIGELNFQIWEALEDADIEIPFPQRDLHVKADSDWEKLGTVVGERDASPDGSDDTSAGDLPGDEHH
jgi:small-conductance mechanosensitive channel